MDMITYLDTLLLDLIQYYLKTNFLDTFFVFVTKLGDAGIIWIIMALILLLRKSTRKYGILLVIALLVSTLINNIGLKLLIARSRPCWVNNVELLINMPKDYSFPSGHTCSSMASAYIINKMNSKLGILAYLVAILIAFSRLYLYVHYPSDVLVGAIVGSSVSYFVYKYFKK